MQTQINNRLPALHKTTPYLFKMLHVPLSNVPFHQNTEAIIRYFADGFPAHVAVHEVLPVPMPAAEYTQPHVHDDCDEINITIAPDDYVTKIRLGLEEHMVNNNACIWIPKGLVHAANVLSGSGYYITVRMA